MKKQVKRKERKRNKLGKEKVKDNKAITLIALVITIALNCLRSGRKLECVA